jgi:hypothetical protein
MSRGRRGYVQIWTFLAENTRNNLNFNTYMYKAIFKISRRKICFFEKLQLLSNSRCATL